MLLSEAIKVYLADKIGQRFSPNTLNDYRLWFNRLQAALPGDITITDVTSDQVRVFLATYDQVSKKTLLNGYTALSSLWTWATSERQIITVHIMRQIKPPRPEKKVVQPYSQAEVQRMLATIGFSRSFITKDGGSSKPWETNTMIAARNRGILYFLLDSGLRVSELCGLNVGDVRPGERGVYLAMVGAQYAKGSKARLVPISARTWEVTQLYLARRGSANTDKPLFLTDEGQRMRRDTVRQFLERLAARSGVVGIHAHRFRHTFAIWYLRNGGDSFTLQAILGHATMDMVKRYLALAQTDLERNHAKASPVVNWEM